MNAHAMYKMSFCDSTDKFLSKLWNNLFYEIMHEYIYTFEKSLYMMLEFSASTWEKLFSVIRSTSATKEQEVI